MKTINFEKKLNQQFADLPNEFVFEQLIYLTSKHRGKHITERTLKSHIANETCGSLLRKYDPIAFFVAKHDYEN